MSVIVEDIVVISDDEDIEDDIPLHYIKKQNNCDNNSTSYESLCTPSKQPCELCDHVSTNRYKSLIHNVRHIIIPLINQRTFKCGVCLHDFTSQLALNRHISRKHNMSELINVINLRQLNNPNDGLAPDLTPVVKKEYPDTIVNTMVQKPMYDINQSNSISDRHSLKNRLLFEEDIVPSNCDKLLEDLTTDCKVKVEWFPPVWEFAYPKSVHYDELIKPGVYRCKKCGKRFPTRYEAVMHEAHHIYIKYSQVSQCKLCNQYILGDSNKLLQHNITSHPEPIFSKFRYRKLADTKKFFGGNSVANGVIDEPYVTKMTQMKICEFCLSFCKNNDFNYYDIVGELNELGTRHKCEKCGFKFFMLKLVNRVTKYKYSSYQRRKNKKVMTNEDRLKMITQRFKMMKKPYYVVLFTVPI